MRQQHGTMERDGGDYFDQEVVRLKQMMIVGGGGGIESKRFFLISQQNICCLYVPSLHESFLETKDFSARTL